MLLNDKMVVKRMWKVAFGLFLLPFGIIISSVYLVSCLFTFQKPSKKDEFHALTKHSVNSIDEGLKG